MPTKKPKKQKPNDALLAAEIGAGVAAAGAAIVAGYYFYGAKDAKKHRAAASKWAKGLKDDVAKGAKKLKRIDQKSVAAVVDAAMAAYASSRIDPKELKAAARELKSNWRRLGEEVKSKPAAKKVAKKAPAKKAAKKSRK